MPPEVFSILVTHRTIQMWVIVKNFKEAKEIRLDTVRSFLGTKNLPGLTWQGVKGKLNFTRDDLRGALLELEQPVWVVED